MDNSLQPFIRDRFHEFASKRSASAHWCSQSLPHAPPEVVDSGIEKRDCVNPSWFRAVEGFTALEKTVRGKLKSLFEHQCESLQPKFASDDKEEAQKRLQIDKEAQEVQMLLGELERMVSSCDFHKHTPTVDEQKVSENVKKYLSTHLVQLVHTFRGGQMFFATKLRQQEDKVKLYRLVGSQETHRRMEQEDRITHYLGKGYTQTVAQELLLEDEREHRVNCEIGDILESVRTLHAVFENLSSLVVEQGSTLDRIDVAIEQTRAHVSNGVSVLKQTRDSQSSCALM